MIYVQLTTSSQRILKIDMSEQRQSDFCMAPCMAPVFGSMILWKMWIALRPPKFQAPRGGLICQTFTLCDGSNQPAQAGPSLPMSHSWNAVQRCQVEDFTDIPTEQHVSLEGEKTKKVGKPKVKLCLCGKFLLCLHAAYVRQFSGIYCINTYINYIHVCLTVYCLSGLLRLLF